MRSLIVDGARCVRNGSPHLVNRIWTPRVSSDETDISPRAAAAAARFPPWLAQISVVRLTPISARIPSLTIYGLSRAFFVPSPLSPILSSSALIPLAVALGK